MIAAATRTGYAHATVSAVTAEAGVSRPTFYEYFNDRDDCFVRTIEECQARLLADVEQTLEGGAPADALTTAIRVMVEFARRRPAEAQIVTLDALAGPPAALDARDGFLSDLARRVDTSLFRAPRSGVAPDVPSAIVLGGVQRLLATALRRGDRQLAGLDEDLAFWCSRYSSLVRSHRWRALAPTTALDRPTRLVSVDLTSTDRAPRRERGGSPAELAEVRRQQLMSAAATTAREQGFWATTVADIAAAAGTDKWSFYEDFRDKVDVFAAVHESGTLRFISNVSRAFFAVRPWPVRLWDGLDAATRAIDASPAFAHVALVSAYAIGPLGVRRAEDSRVTLAMFFEEGRVATATAPTRVEVDASIAVAFELAYRLARSASRPRASAYLPAFAHLLMTPFLGLDAAGELIAREAAEWRRATSVPNLDARRAAPLPAARGRLVAGP